MYNRQKEQALQINSLNLNVKMLPLKIFIKSI